MKIKHFERILGKGIENIYKCPNIGFSLSDTIDFYDMIELSKKRDYKGSIISFYDFSNGKIYEPFKQYKNIIYTKPVYIKGYLWFLQGDYNKGKIILYKYRINEMPEIITQLNIEEIDLYNLSIIGEDMPYIISLDDKLTCYYPQSFSFINGVNESPDFIADGKIYLSKWIEEGWDDEKNCATDEYKYYEKLIIRNFNGEILSDELGCLHQHTDGSWWLS